MMYTFGDVRLPFPATAHIVEDLVREHLLRIVRPASIPAHARVHALNPGSPAPSHFFVQVALARQETERRGARQTQVEDVLFAVRHDRPLVRRVAAMLTWRELRKAGKAGVKGEEATTTVSTAADIGAQREPAYRRPWPPLTCGKRTRRARGGAAIDAAAGTMAPKQLRLSYDFLQDLTADLPGQPEAAADELALTAAERRSELQRLLVRAPTQPTRLLHCSALVSISSRPCLFLAFCCLGGGRGQQEHEPG